MTAPVRERARPPEEAERTFTVGKVAEQAGALRQALVARALSPLRRVTGRDVQVVPEVIPPRPTTLPDNSFEPAARRNWHPVRWTLIGFVVLPTIIAGLYLFIFASDQYIAEARFAVRHAEPLQGTVESGSANSEESSSKKPVGGGAAAMLGGTMNLGGEDAEILASYIHSRAIIVDVSRDLDVRAIFQRPEADFWARLPSDASAEELAKYWKSMVMVRVEATSGIVTVSVCAFRREDALVLAQAILKSSEALVNRLSAKTRADMELTAENEVRRSEGEVRFAMANLTAFRNAQHVIDPLQSSESLGKLLLTLMTDKIEAEGALYVAQRVQGPNAPGMASLRDKLQSINDHITQIKSQMAGEQDDKTTVNMAGIIAEFEGLELKKEFSEAMFRFARTGVERARITAERQQVYLGVFEPPSLPQEYSYPLRWSDLLLVALASLMLWTCGATITASVIDHRL